MVAVAQFFSEEAQKHAAKADLARMLRAQQHGVIRMASESREYTVYSRSAAVCKAVAPSKLRLSIRVIVVHFDFELLSGTLT